MRSQKGVLCGTPLFGRMTGRSRPHLSLREGLEQPPFPLALHRVGSVFAVKGSLRRFAPWTAPGPIRNDEALTRGKGGFGPWGARAVKAKVQPFDNAMHSLARVEAMLLGMALECLLKGIYIKRHRVWAGPY